MQTCTSNIPAHDFQEIITLFQTKGWNQPFSALKNQNQNLEFQSPTNDYDIFEIRITNTGDILVTIPLKMSKYKFTTRFQQYDSACEFIKMHLSWYESLSSASIQTQNPPFIPFPTLSLPINCTSEA